MSCGRRYAEIDAADLKEIIRKDQLPRIGTMNQMGVRFLLYPFFSVLSGVVLGQDSAVITAPPNPGKLVYEQNCPGCHGWDARGELNVAPPLIKGTFVGGDKIRLIRLMLEGLEEVEIKGQYYPSPMPSFSYLSDSEIADVLTFVRSNFSNDASAVTAAEVAKVRNKK